MTVSATQTLMPGGMPFPVHQRQPHRLTLIVAAEQPVSDEGTTHVATSTRPVHSRDAGERDLGSIHPTSMPHQADRESA